MSKAVKELELRPVPVASIDLSDGGYSFTVELRLPLSGPMNPDLDGNDALQKRVAWSLLRELYG